jgi:hypothetical protein
MDTITVIENFKMLHKTLSKYREDKRWLFRGHSDPKWDLLPKAGRSPYCEVDDAMVFNAWKRQAVEYVQYRPQNDWEWLAIAQHHGLATRLLDWTLNPLNAAFFATRETNQGNAVIFAAKFKLTVPNDNTKPMSFKDLAMFRPHRVVPRITRQGGVFTIHPNPKEPILRTTKNIIELHRLEISAAYRETLLSELSFYGINAASLFPDLDGLSQFLNWTIEFREYWNFPGLDKEQLHNNILPTTRIPNDAPCE